MDPTLLMQLFQTLGLGGGGAGGVGQPTVPPGSLGVPYTAPTMALPQSTQAAPEDVTPMPVEPSPGPGLRMPTMADARSALSRSPPQPDPMMSPTGGVPYPQIPTPTSLGEALQPQPAPMPMPRPPGMGSVGGGGEGVLGTNIPTPQPRPPGAPGATTPGGGQDIAKMLQGIKVPQGPDVVKPSTPAAHQTRAIGPSDLMALLASLGMGGHRSQRTPTTLGQALELKPSAWGGMYG